MSERKVLNKYYPPDFDPSKIKRRKLGGERQQVVRLMAPFSMKCNTCGEYIYKGKKFNARKESAKGEDYYGIQIYRFYIKCTRCSAEITFKTDPKNTDYVAEHGAQRNFEPWREDTGEDIDRIAQLEADELAIENEGKPQTALDPMAALEDTTAASKREMEILDKLQDIRSRNARLERAGKDLDRITTAAAVGEISLEEQLRREEQERWDAEDEEEVRKVFSRIASTKASIELDEAIEEEEEPAEEEQDKAGPSIKRKLDEYEPSATDLLSESAKAILSQPSTATLNGSAAAALALAKKKKASSDMAKKLGIKVKGKGRAN